MDDQSVTAAFNTVKEWAAGIDLCFQEKIIIKIGQMADTYIHKHSEANVSHSVCPDCMKEHYPEFDIIE